MNCKSNRLTTSWLKKNVDLQKQVSSIFEVPIGQRYSLENAINVLEIEVGEDLHRALADARYTAQIFTKTFAKLDLTIFNSIELKKKPIPKAKFIEKQKLELKIMDKL